MLTREQILAKRQDLPRETVEIDGLGQVCIRTMTATERGKLIEAQKKLNGADAMPLLAAASLCDESGALLFTAEHLPMLGELPAKTLDAIGLHAMRINGMNAEAVDDAKKDSPRTLS